MTALILDGPAVRASGPARVRAAAGLVFVIAAATIGGALVFQHGFGLSPCKLCLLQRDPYYLALPVAAATWALAARRPARLGLLALALIFAVSAGLGAYHAGVEWGVFQGPADCAAAGGATSGEVGAFLDQLARARVTSCTEAAWRFLGLSLAGWNVLVSLGLAALAAAGLAQGSSSVSQ